MIDPLPADVERAKNRLVDAGVAALRRDLATVHQRPATLYHFTDVGGLMGILRRGSLWASYAASLNDPSELRHGISMARAVLQEGIPDIPPAFCSAVVACLDGSSAFDFPFSMEWRPYVVSFSEDHERAPHWLHYGRDGTGYAVEILPGAVAVAPFDLVRVLYQEDAQRELVRYIVERMHVMLAETQEELAPSDRVAIQKATVHMTATFLRAAAVRLKHPGFADEREWRVVTYELVINGELQAGGIDLPKDWRVVAGRLVPYMIHRPANPFISGVVRGWSAAMSADDPALRMLLAEVGLADLPVTNSDVPVRP